MLSNLASYIFGANTETVAEGQQIHEVKADKATASSRKGQQDEDWEIVGGDVQPPLNLGSLDEVAPRPSTGSTGSSETPSEVSKPFFNHFFKLFIHSLLYFSKDGQDDVEDMVVVDNAPIGPREIALTRSARRLTSPLSCPNGVSLPQMKALRSSQKAKQKNAVRQLTSKATDRHNKAVKIRSNQPKKAANMAIKASGSNKQLKQC